jgi:hypothetical protein
MSLLFSLVSLLGAFLLFQVQPMISKFILPWFGGSPSVWTVCMLFFQVMLFGGYSYAHFLSKRSARSQALLHGALLLLAAWQLPVVPNDALKPAGSGDPSWQIFVLLFSTVGLPYFVLSATSPLVQTWYARVFPGRVPYRLYALSNIGSLAALLTYPVLIETRWDVVEQADVWSVVYGVFAVLMLACAIVEWLRGRSLVALPVAAELGPAPLEAAPSGRQRGLWVALPAFASVMLLSTTNHVCQDVAVIPFLWVVPLALYLLSFIICFDHPRWYARPVWGVLAVIALLLSAGWEELPWIDTRDYGIVAEIAVNFLAMFFVCVVCHGELVRKKPGVAHLTEYYLFMSAGGALGGLIVSLLAPVIFTTYLEWSVGLMLGTVIAAWVVYRGLHHGGVRRSPQLSAATLAVVVVGALYCIQSWQFARDHAIARSRNFYGTLKVSQRQSVPERPGEVALEFRALHCNGTEHGRQFTRADLRREPLSYYGAETAVGQLLTALQSKAQARVGIVGMGTGTLASYGVAGQTYRFYEINPDVVTTARAYFTFVDDMQARGGIYQLALGDARLVLGREADQHFDALVLDAFSGDSVPVHLLTSEAFAIYQRHLVPGGVIAIHITNRYLNLAPVVERLAREFGFATTRISVQNVQRVGHYHPDYLLLSKDKDLLAHYPPVLPPYARDIPSVALWTDRAHNLFQILHAR